MIVDLSENAFFNDFASRFFYAPSIFYARALSHLAASGCELATNDTFSFWCGKQLCDWQAQNGTIRPAPTWHPADHGVELVTDGVSISQVFTPQPPLFGGTPTFYSGECLRVDLVANIIDGATLSVGLDFGNDGTIDQQKPFSSAIHWDEQPLALILPEDATSLRLHFIKTGGGSAVLGKVSIRFEEDALCTSTRNTQNPAP